MLTNEELVLCIQQGKEEYIPDLWEQVRKLVCMMCVRYYHSKQERCAAAGVDIDDLEQEGYIAVLKAVTDYKPENGWKFSTYLRYHLLSALNNAAGLRTNKKGNDITYSSARLDAVVSGTDDSLFLLDTVPDKEAEREFESVEDKLYHEQLRRDLDNAIEKLQEREKLIITEKYYNEKRMSRIADEQRITLAAVYDREKKALRKLSRDNRIREYRDDIISRYGYNSGFGLWKNMGTSSTEYTALKLIERIEEYREQKTAHA